jgi:hypothetical protein
VKTLNFSQLSLWQGLSFLISWENGENSPPTDRTLTTSLCWALPLQGQGLSHLIQLLEVLPY